MMKGETLVSEVGCDWVTCTCYQLCPCFLRCSTFVHVFLETGSRRVHDLGRDSGRRSVE